MILQLKTTPNARKNEIIADAQGNIKVKIKAPPVDGKANKELINFLSDIFDAPKSQIEILSGQTSRHKKVKIIENEKKLEAVLEKLKVKL
ncbi:MAG: YggU family protein [Flavobacteriales bacterium]|nr:MAG: YggU family protein [Flavobacteriales bacterium]